MPPFYEVGYGKPPKHTRFQKGQSGNPGGRRRGMTQERAKALALKEAYRKLPVADGDGVRAMPAIQAIMRSQVALAARGNGPAQRAVITAVRAIEEELAAKAVADDARMEALRPKTAADYRQAARRIGYLLKLGRCVFVDENGVPEADQSGAAYTAEDIAAGEACAAKARAAKEANANGADAVEGADGAQAQGCGPGQRGRQRPGQSCGQGLLKGVRRDASLLRATRPCDPNH
jgi:hypothetical protein